jgi:hypothetical protein
MKHSFIFVALIGVLLALGSMEARADKVLSCTEDGAVPPRSFNIDFEKHTLSSLDKGVIPVSINEYYTVSWRTPDLALKDRYVRIDRSTGRFTAPSTYSDGTCKIAASSGAPKI